MPRARVVRLGFFVVGMLLGIRLGFGEESALLTNIRDFILVHREAPDEVRRDLFQSYRRYLEPALERAENDLDLEGRKKFYRDYVESLSGYDLEEIESWRTRVRGNLRLKERRDLVRDWLENSTVPARQTAMVLLQFQGASGEVERDLAAQATERFRQLAESWRLQDLAELNDLGEFFDCVQVFERTLGGWNLFETLFVRAFEEAEEQGAWGLFNNTWLVSIPDAAQARIQEALGKREIVTVVRQRNDLDPLRMVGSQNEIPCRPVLTATLAKVRLKLAGDWQTFESIETPSWPYYLPRGTDAVLSYSLQSSSGETTPAHILTSTGLLRTSQNRPLLPTQVPSGRTVAFVHDLDRVLSFWVEREPWALGRLAEEISANRFVGVREQPIFKSLWGAIVKPEDLGDFPNSKAQLDALANGRKERLVFAPISQIDSLDYWSDFAKYTQSLSTGYKLPNSKQAETIDKLRELGLLEPFPFVETSQVPTERFSILTVINLSQNQ